MIIIVASSVRMNHHSYLRFHMNPYPLTPELVYSEVDAPAGQVRG